MGYKNIIEILNNSGKNTTFLEIEGQKISYKDFSLNVRKLCGLFQNYGLKQGDKVVVATKTDYDTIVFFFSLLCYGITAVLTDINTNPQRAEAIIEQVEPSGFIVEEYLVDRWNINTTDKFFLILKDKPKKSALFRKLLGKKDPENSENSGTYPNIMDSLIPIESLPADINEETLAYILFTSGTTSDPKGVMISHKNLFSHLETLSKFYKLNSQANILNNLMLYHADGIIQGPVLAAYNGATLIRPIEQFDINKIGDLFNAIYKYRISHFFVVPTILSLMYKFSEGYEDSFITDDFKFIISVSAHIEKDLWEKFEKKFNTKIVNVYGLTETVAGSLFCGTDDNERKIGSVGKPVDCEARIIINDGSEAEINEQGELILRGEHITPGYFKNINATEQLIKDGWLYTGDLSIIDEKGFFSIVGRKKNIVISGGINIQPEEVSEIINSHPDIVESICFGIEDEIFGEKLISCIVKKTNSLLDTFILSEYLRSRIESSKIPAKIFILESLPKGLSGKVQLNEIKAIISSKLTTKTEKKNYQESLFRAASEAFKVPVNVLNPDDSSKTLNGWDSMAHLTFITLLEKNLNIRFSTAEIMIMNSLKSAENILLKKFSKANE